MANYSPFTDKYARQYGVPAEVLDSAAYVGDYDLESMVEYAAKDLRAQYDADSSGDWASAIDKYARGTYGGQGDKYARDIKSAAGLKSEGIKSDLGGAAKNEDKESGWLDGKVFEWFGGGFTVIFGAALIILALLSVKPVRDAAAAVAIKG